MTITKKKVLLPKKINLNKGGKKESQRKSGAVLKYIGRLKKEHAQIEKEAVRYENIALTMDWSAPPGSAWTTITASAPDVEITSVERK